MKRVRASHAPLSLAASALPSLNPFHGAVAAAAVGAADSGVTLTRAVAGAGDSEKPHKRVYPHAAVAHLPHAAKNVHILTGYMVHARKREACAAPCRLHNETCNIWTALGPAVAAALAVSCAAGGACGALGGGEGPGLLLPPTVRAALGAFAAASLVNAALVAAYHAAAPLPAAYAAASAADIAAVAIVSAGCQAVHALAPGVSAVGAALVAAEEAAVANAGGGASFAQVAAFGLRAALAPVAEALAGVPLGPRALLAIALGGTALIAGAMAVLRRLLVRGESPKLLLLAVISPAIAATVDYGAAAPHSGAWVPAALLLTGLALFASKFPERLYVLPPASANEACAKVSEIESSQVPSRPVRTRAQAALARQVPPGTLQQQQPLLTPQFLPRSAPTAATFMRLIDFIGHSHMLHHICYSVSLAIMAAGYASAFAREACVGSAAGDYRCAAHLP